MDLGISPTEEQLEALKYALTGNVVLRAGPGAGKTYTLTIIYQALRALGREVVVMSYTHASADSFNYKLQHNAATTMHSFCRTRFGVEASFDTTFLRAIEIVKSLPSLLPGCIVSCLVDEAQDCNKDQFQLLQALMCKGYHVVCVGDAQQSIYKFHGAVPELFLHFDDTDGISGFDLTENWRSTPALVHAFNDYARYNFEKPLQQRSVRTSKEGVPPRFVSFGGEDDLYEEIARLHRQSPMLTALLVLDNQRLDESHVLLFEKGVPCITFSAERSDEWKRVPEDLRCVCVMQLLTIWGAKGHDFQRVIVLGAEDQGEGKQRKERASSS